jgi:sugar lactone lactonase YvrE
LSDRAPTAENGTVTITDPQVLCDDLMFAEAPRWHDGRLYASDFYAQEVVAIDLDGRREQVVAVPQQPSGLGFLPGGDLLIASMRDASVLRFDGTTLQRIASVEASPVLNDMVVSPEGRAYVGGMPDLYAMLGEGATTATEITIAPEHLYLVEPGAPGEPARQRIVASDIEFPNGAVITPDGRTLIVAETMGLRLTAFDIEADGSLANRRVWAELGHMPDGICLDAEGCIWVAVPDPPGSQGFLRVAEGGEIKDRVASDRPAAAVELGGPDGHDLFLLEAKVIAVNEMAQASVRGNGRVRIARADVPGAAFA